MRLTLLFAAALALAACNTPDQPQAQAPQLRAKQRPG